MIYVDGEKVPGVEKARLVFFGEGEVSGRAEIADDQNSLEQERFDFYDVLPIIGVESMVRIIGFATKTRPDLFDHIRRIQPAGLMTFGVVSEVAAEAKGGGTHMDIFLREWGYGNGPRVPFLGVSVENVYQDRRQAALDYLRANVASREVVIARVEDGVHITSR